MTYVRSVGADIMSLISDHVFHVLCEHCAHDLKGEVPPTTVRWSATPETCCRCGIMTTHRALTASLADRFWCSWAVCYTPPVMCQGGHEFEQCLGDLCWVRGHSRSVGHDLCHKVYLVINISALPDREICGLRRA